jgi:hypothetical protein
VNGGGGSVGQSAGSTGTVTVTDPGGGHSSQFGRASAPTIPQAVQTIR